MNDTTKAILGGMGFTSVDSKIEMPKAIGLLGLGLTILRCGTGTVLFCHGGQAEYDLVKNHLPGKVRDVEEKEANGVPYLTMSKDKVIATLRSIAHFRILEAGKERQRARHQVVANKLAARWFNELPSESSLHHAVVLNEMVADA